MRNPEQKPTCKTCQHYVPHYTRSARGVYHRLYCGHCTEPRIKDRREDTPACPHYRPRKENKSPDSP